MEEVTTRRPELDEQSRKDIAKAVSVAAIRYDIVKIIPEKSTVFDWKDALDFEKQSGPYIQYGHARACSILDKQVNFLTSTISRLKKRLRWQKQIAKFPKVISQVVTELKPYPLLLCTRTCGYIPTHSIRPNRY